MSETRDMMDKIRKLTLSKPFRIEEFATLSGVENSDALFGRMITDCYVRPSGKGEFVVIHGKERKKYINERIDKIKSEMNKLYMAHNHLKSL